MIMNVLFFCHLYTICVIDVVIDPLPIAHQRIAPESIHERAEIDEKRGRVRAVCGHGVICH
jgi:hypothetical protein